MKRQNKNKTARSNPDPRHRSEQLLNAIANCKVGPAQFFEKNIARHGMFGEYRKSTIQGECVLFGSGVSEVAKAIGFKGRNHPNADRMIVSNNMRKRARKLGVASASREETDAAMEQSNRRS